MLLSQADIEALLAYYTPSHIREIERGFAFRELANEKREKANETPSE